MRRHRQSIFYSLGRMVVLTFSLYYFFAETAYAQITIVVENASAFPDSIHNNIYLAGNFNDWNPADKKYKLNYTNGTAAITFTPKKNITALEYKFTHGDWSKAEVHADGAQTQNRTAQYVPGLRVEAKIEGWDDLLPDRIQAANSNVIQFKVYSPELKREKNIRVYLPCDYKTTESKFPVLYMLDGQNLFDGSYTAEWGIDEAMDSACSLHIQPAIVVGIDHAGEMRLTEYSPYKIKKMEEGGEGDAFAQFVAHTLKPKIDSLYRTQPGRENTAIAGSSMGGLMSLYMVLNYNNTFGKAMVFSPSLWTNEKNFKNAENYSSALPTKIYFVMGAKEGGKYDFMFDMQRMYYILLKKQIPALQMRYIIESEAQHNENFWRAEFLNGYIWLME